jgi:hypothetical protein
VTSTDPADEVRTALAILGPMAENAVVTNTPEPRVLFDMLHLSDDGTKVRHWDLPVGEALLLLTGAIDGANYTMQLVAMGEERTRRTRRTRRPRN